MKSPDDFPEICEWLRSQKPDAATPPGLEARILRALNQESQEREKLRRFWLWLALPAAFACLLLVLIPKKPQSPPEVVVSPPAVPTVPEAAVVETKDPLLAESQALGRDLERAGGFLIQCLPSVGNRNP